MTASAHISGNIAEPGSTQINNVSLNTTYTTDDLDRACLHALRCPDPLVVKTRLKEKDKLLYKSIEWVVRDAQYARWQNSKDVSLLWIKGGAGKGKTMMTIGLIEQLEQSLRPHEQPPVMAYFFCQNTNYELNTIEGIIKGLIWRLVDQQKEVCEPLRRQWDCDNRRFREDLTSWRALWNIFVAMLHRCKSRKIYVIIDALDECQGQDMAAFLQLIVRTGFSSKVKWLLTSRPLDSAGRELLTASDQVMVSLELNTGHVSKAVKSYITQKAAELDRRHHYGPALCRQLEAELTAKAEDTYLWVSLVCKRLESVDKTLVLATTKELPPGLTPFYHRIFDKLREGELAVVNSSMRLLKVMLTVYRPLKEEEVSSVTGLHLKLGETDLLIDRCASFVRKRGARIEFVHQSARDYLAQEAQITLSSYGSWAHGEIALSCLHYLSQQLKVNLVNLPRPDSERGSMERLPNVVGKGLLDSVNYAATFWAQHLADAEPITLLENVFEDQREVIAFLRAKMLEWFECLSLLDQLQRAIEALKTLADRSENPSLLAIVQDATRFLLRHYYTIAKWPLQTYSSAVVLSPQTSIVRVANLGKIPRWLKAAPKVEATWAALVQTLGGHSSSVTAVAFSPDGKHIASGSEDQTVKLWDATTGDYRKTLEGHSDSVLAVAFSPDGKHIASGSEDQTVKLWDATTGDYRKTLEGHSDIVTAVAFSPDSKHTASASWDNTVKLWDATTGDYRKTLEGHSDSVIAVAFSPDGKHIASGSGDQTVKLWDATTGNYRKTLEGHSGGVLAVAFSPDGKHIASGSEDQTVKLWDATTGDYRKTLEGHSDIVTAVAFSPDSKHIASGSSDQTVKLWDATTGDYRKTLEGHFDIVIAIAFSPEGKHIASGSGDQTVKLWDATTGDYRKTLEDHSNSVIAVAFSPDGKHIASGSSDQTVKLWDATTGDYRKTLEGHSDVVSAVAFSPDSKHIASASWDNTVKLWDATTGDYRKTLEGHSNSVIAVAFSPDGKHIASGSGDQTVKLWDATTGDCRKTLEGHSDGVLAVAFSPDGKHIASGSSDQTVKLWDATTGDYRKTLEGHSDVVTAVAFSPDSKHIASGSGDQTVKLWDVAKAFRRAKFLGTTLDSHLKYRSRHEIKTSHFVSSIKYSEDGTKIITNVGALTVEDVASDAHGQDSTSLEELWVSGTWLCYGTIRLLWLASDSKPIYYDAKGDQVAVGFISGQVLVFDIDRRRLDACLRTNSVCDIQGTPEQ